MNTEQTKRLSEKAPEALIALSGAVREAYAALKYSGAGMDVALALAALERARATIEELEDFVALGAPMWPPETYEKRGER
jgi:hypothetical protein